LVRKERRIMREFKITGIITDDNSRGFVDFMKSVERQINKDDEIIQRSEKVNLEFSEKITSALQDDENRRFLGSMIAAIQAKTPRYSYIKHLKYNGKEYIAEIDELERTFYLSEC
jgi:tRNA uridine 5-carbamoylmethylation protein Kti12